LSLDWLNNWLDNWLNCRWDRIKSKRKCISSICRRRNVEDVLSLRNLSWLTTTNIKSQQSKIIFRLSGLSSKAYPSQSCIKDVLRLFWLRLLWLNSGWSIHNVVENIVIIDDTFYWLWLNLLNNGLADDWCFLLLLRFWPLVHWARLMHFWSLILFEHESIIIYVLLLWVFDSFDIQIQISFPNRDVFESLNSKFEGRHCNAYLLLPILIPIIG